MHKSSWCQTEDRTLTKVVPVAPDWLEPVREAWLDSLAKAQ